MFYADSLPRQRLLSTKLSIIYSNTLLPVVTMFSDGLVYYINDRDYRRGNQEWTIHRVHKIQDDEKQSKNTEQYVEHHYAQTSTNNVN